MVALPVALAAKAGIVQDFAKSLGSLGAKLGIGDTPTDKQRKREAADLLNGALAGDQGALAKLITNAFSGTRPKAVQGLAKEALKRYAKHVGGLPIQYAEYAAKLGVPALSANAIIEAIGTSGRAPAPVNPSDLDMPAQPSGIPVALIAVGVGLAIFAVARRSRRS